MIGENLVIETAVPAGDVRDGGDKGLAEVTAEAVEAVPPPLEVHARRHFLSPIVKGGGGGGDDDDDDDGWGRQDGKLH